MIFKTIDTFLCPNFSQSIVFLQFFLSHSHVFLHTFIHFLFYLLQFMFIRFELTYYPLEHIFFCLSMESILLFSLVFFYLPSLSGLHANLIIFILHYQKLSVSFASISVPYYYSGSKSDQIGK